MERIWSLDFGFHFDMELKALFKILLMAGMVFSSAGAKVSASARETTAPIALENRHGVVLRNFAISDAPANAVLLRSCSNVLVDDADVREAAGEAFHLIDCTSVTIRGCSASTVRTGVYAINCSGIRVVGNRFRNVTGPMPRGQFVQFNNVSGESNLIRNNVCVNIPGESSPEDAISIYKSHGTAGSPISVQGNRIRGGGPSTSGGGIMAGDGGGSYISVSGNELVDPGQYGIAVAGGTNISITSNTIVGRQQPFTNVGLYVWNQYQEPCGEIRVSGNRVRWINKDGKRSSAWNAGNCGAVDGWDKNEWNADIDVPGDFPDSAIGEQESANGGS